jgi:hypothetical protein
MLNYTTNSKDIEIENSSSNDGYFAIVRFDEAMIIFDRRDGFINISEMYERDIFSLFNLCFNIDMSQKTLFNRLHHLKRCENNTFNGKYIDPKLVKSVLRQIPGDYAKKIKYILNKIKVEKKNVVDDSFHFNIC